MNGWRNSMEDAHIIHLREGWGFFGVFDGHGGEQCSKWVADRLSQDLTRDGCPVDDAAVKKLILDCDADFLDSKQPSGSTAAMCIIHKPTGDGKHKLRVINAGDSRVLLGRRDGTIVDGGGTEEGLTTDHKPNHPDERDRIYRCGGHVEENHPGVPRVNGDLAVSRGFGDAEYKKTGGPGPEDRPVTANPELGVFYCDPTDFLMIVCDGVSEGDFPNPEVVKMAAECLREKDDPAAACKAICHKAVEKNSKDNITCMIVLLEGMPTAEREAHKALENQWAGRRCVMLGKKDLDVAKYLDGTGVSLASIEDADFIYALGTNTICDGSSVKDVDCEASGNCDAYKDLFSRAVEKGIPLLCAVADTDNASYLKSYEELGGKVQYYGKQLKDVEFNPGEVPTTDGKLVAAYKVMAAKAGLSLAQAMEMRYEYVLEQLAKKDKPGGPSAELAAKLDVELNQLGIPEGKERREWFRTLAENTENNSRDAGGDDQAQLMQMLLQRRAGGPPDSRQLPAQDDEDEHPERVQAPDVETLRTAVENHSGLKWDTRMEKCANQIGFVKRKDPSDGTTNVRFPAPVGIVAWLPTDALIEIEDDTSESRPPYEIGGSENDGFGT